MKSYRTVLVEGIPHTICISDEQEALLAAQAAGGAVLGLWDPDRPQEAPWGIPFLADRNEEPDEEFLVRIIQRKEGIPWRIADTGRLILREFQESDWEAVSELKQEKDCPPAFFDRESFCAYIRTQYAFYQYGIWAVLEKERGLLAGAAGVWNMEDGPVPSALELGYWIRRSCRGRGYGLEAAAGAAEYALENLTDNLYARIRRENRPSRNIVRKLGFCCLENPDLREQKKEKNVQDILLFCHSVPFRRPADPPE